LTVWSEQMQETTSFFRKEAKRLSVLWSLATLAPTPTGPKVFGYFFSKK
jgi:hypothetical protein